MATMTISVQLDEKQSGTAIKHYGEKRMNSLIADIQRNVRSFLDKLAEEDEEDLSYG